jgi:hypothetical protein
MSQSEIGIGTTVVCIDDDWQTINPGVRYPYKGEILTVREIERGREPHTANLIGLYFVEIVNPMMMYYGYMSAEQSFESSSFRPVRKTDISVFTELLETPPLIVELVE